MYELGQMSLKFERHFDAEIIDFQVLCIPDSHTICQCGWSLVSVCNQQVIRVIICA